MSGDRSRLAYVHVGCCCCCCWLWPLPLGVEVFVAAQSHLEEVARRLLDVVFVTVSVAVVAELRWRSLERERGGRCGEECLADGARVVSSLVLIVFDILGLALILLLNLDSTTFRLRMSLSERRLIVRSRLRLVLLLWTLSFLLLLAFLWVRSPLPVAGWPAICYVLSSSM